MNSIAKSVLTTLVVAFPMLAVFAQSADISTQNQTTSVAVALHEKDAYLQQQYSPNALPKKVFDTIVQGGARSASFKRISIDSKTVADKAGAAIPISSDTDSIYENAGNGFVRQVNVTKLNGFEQNDFFALSYKGVMDLRAQAISVSATTMPPIAGMISISRFDGAVDGPHFSYVGTDAFNTPGSPSEEVHYECSGGSSYPASQINPAIQGSAHDVECQALNANGIVTGVSRYGYLEKYGFAILMHFKSPNLETSKTVTSFKEG